MNWVAWGATGFGAYLGTSLLFVVCWHRAICWYRRPSRDAYYPPVAEAEAILTAHGERRPGS
jgi:hypothetical protein